METRRKVVVVDFSGLISLLRVEDELHGRALDVKARIADEHLHLLLPHEVFAETLNAIGKKHGRRAAIQTADILLAGHDAGDLELVASSRDVLHGAARLQARAVGSPSFIDCLVMITADQHLTKYVFGFDTAFRKNRYLLPGEHAEEGPAA